MAGFSSALSVLPQIQTGLSLANNIIGYKSDRDTGKADMRALQARQQADYDAAVRKASDQRAEISLKAAEDESKRKLALKRLMARQRAQYGASGISSDNSGSAQALLLGLFEESEGERKRREELDKLRYQALDSDLAQKRQTNILELENLRTRQKINNLPGIGGIIGNTLSVLN